MSLSAVFHMMTLVCPHPHTDTYILKKVLKINLYVETQQHSQGIIIMYNNKNHIIEEDDIHYYIFTILQ